MSPIPTTREEWAAYWRENPPSPSKPRRCMTPRCPEVIAYGSRCKRHGGSNWDKYKHEHPERAIAYANPRWKERRTAWLAEHPSCAACGRPATDVDHIVAVGLGGSFDGPVQSLCRPCHLRKTAEDSKAAKRRR